MTASTKTWSPVGVIYELDIQLSAGDIAPRPPKSARKQDPRSSG